MKIVIKWRLLDKFFKATGSTPLHLYYFVQYGLEIDDNPCSGKSYMGEFYIAEMISMYHSIKKAFGIEGYPVTETNTQGRKLVIATPPFVSVDGVSMQNYRFFAMYKNNKAVRKIVDNRFLKHYNIKLK